MLSITHIEQNSSFSEYLNSFCSYFHNTSKFSYKDMNKIIPDRYHDVSTFVTRKKIEMTPELV